MPFDRRTTSDTVVTKFISFLGLWFEFDLFTDELSKLFGRLHGFQPAVEADRRLDITVSKHPPYRLIGSRMMLEIDRRRGVAKLMRRDPKSDRLLDTFNYLFAEQQFILGLTALSRKQPGGVRSAKQRRSELMNIFINEVRQQLIELEVQIDFFFTS